MPTNQAFEELFRERFENLEETPPAFAWSKIQQEIKPAPARTPKAGVAKQNWLAPGAVIALISVALLFVLKYNKAMENQPVATQTKMQTSQPLPVKTEAEPAQATATVTEKATTEKTAFKAYQPKNEVQLNPAKANSGFVKKPYLAKVKKSETAPATSKKINATKVVYVVTVDPKSTSVEKVSTAVTDSAAAAGMAN